MLSQLWRRAFPLLTTAVLASSVFIAPGTASAQVRMLDPREVALDLSDLPEGFRVEPEGTRREQFPGVGESYLVQMKADASPENLERGPVYVWQMVTRADRLVVQAELFRMMREKVMADQHLGPYPGGQTSASGAQLIGQVPLDGSDRETFAVGRVRDNFVWFTLVGGASPSTTIQAAFELNQRALAKYEALRDRSLHVFAESLFRTPFPPEELPEGFRAGTFREADLSERASRHGAFSELDILMQGPDLENRVTYIVYPSESDARSSFDEAPQAAVERGSLAARPDGAVYPIFCAMRGGQIGEQRLGATTCLALVGFVEVSATSVVADSDSGNLENALRLLDAGVNRLKKLNP